MLKQKKLVSIILSSCLLLLGFTSRAEWGAIPVTVDAVGSVGTHTSMAMINGVPAVSYFDQSNMSLKYAIAIHPTGGSWKTPVTVDNSGYSGYYTSLAQINGKPAISYYDAQSRVLKYVIASDAYGTTWSNPIILDSSGMVGWYTSLIEFQGKPVVSYYDATSKDLKLIQAIDANGNSWDSPVTLDSTGNVGLYTSMIGTANFIAIAYYNETQGQLKYIRATQTTTLSWNNSIVVDSIGDAGRFASLKMVEGNPTISYYGQTSSNLRYIRATDSLGTTWPSYPLVLDEFGDVGKYACLSSIGDKPIISYFDATNQHLKYIRASDNKGKTWSAYPVAIDNSGSVGEYSSMVMVNNNPLISYFDASNQDLKVIFGGMQFDPGNLANALVNTPLKDAPERFGFGDDEQAFEVSVYPNPTSEYLYFDQPLSGEILLYSLNGSLVLQQKMDHGSQLDLSYLEAGNYILKIKLETNNLITHKIVIQ